MAFDSQADIRQRPHLLAGFAPGPLVLRQVLRQISVGRLTIETPSGERIVHQGARPGGEATLVLHRWRPLMKLLTGGDTGLAESYLDGDWESPDLTALLTLAADNIQALEPLVAGKLPIRLLQRFRHWLNNNTKTGSRRNISAHYDLGNAFYELWLDAGMLYSSAIYGDPDVSLEEAQRQKLARIVELLGVRAQENVLEIGCGWGALALQLARQGAHVTGLTLSAQQQLYAQAVVRAAGLEEKADIRLEDYRDVEGQFDRIVSIEMLEAVGVAYWPIYFATLRSRLKQGGTALLQVITIDEARFEGYRRSPDFIQRYIFPGGMLPTKTIISEQARRAGLELVSTETFGEGYARTLVEWRKRFLAVRKNVQMLGFDNSFCRLWAYYLAYCEAGFRSGLIDVGLYRLRG